MSVLTSFNHGEHELSLHMHIVKLQHSMLRPSLLLL
jgi:hypothetical protein